MTTTKPLLFALQVYEGDMLQARKLARLLADLADGELDKNADAMIVYRRDCPESYKIEADLEEAFATVHKYRTTRREIGFPAGPNGMWCDLMHYISTCHTRKRFHYEMVLTTEADALPLVKNWSEKLVQAWRREKSKGKLAVAGHWLENGEHKCGHINGNALFSPMVSSIEHGMLGCPMQFAWDTWFAPIFKAAGWADIPEIRSDYKKICITKAEIDKYIEDGCVWLHGIKDESALKWSRANLLQNNC